MNMNMNMNSIVKTLVNYTAQSSALLSSILESPAFIFAVIFLSLITLTVFYLICISEFKTVAASKRPNNGLDSIDELEELEAEEIELKDIRPFTHKKRPSSESAPHDLSESRVKSPKLMQINANKNEKCQAQVQANQAQPRSKPQSRRSSHPKNEFKTIDLDIRQVDECLFVSKDSDRITLLLDEEDQEAQESVLLTTPSEPPEEASKPPEEQQQQQQELKKPFEWYLRWDLPEGELEKLTYAEKARRYYILSISGEPKQQPSTDADAVNIVTVDYSYERDQDQNDHDSQCVQEAIVKQVSKPVNLLTSIVSASNSIDIPRFQLDLLKMNQSLSYSLTKRIETRNFDYSPVSVLRGQIDYRALIIEPQIKQNLDHILTRRTRIVKEYRDAKTEQYQAECDRLNTSYRIVNHEIVDEYKQQPSASFEKFNDLCDKFVKNKPLNKEQLRNILYIITQ